MMIKNKTNEIADNIILIKFLGYTEVGGSTSNILQKVQLDIIDNQKCKEVYDDEENYNIFNSQLCAGESFS